MDVFIGMFFTFRKLMSKIIIGIHGLGNKPSRAILKEWWQKSIAEGLNKYNYPINQFEFELVYWADILTSSSS